MYVKRDGNWLLDLVTDKGSEVAISLTSVFKGNTRLRYCDANSFIPDPRETQFGIRQLMIFTTLVAVVLGAGRLVVASLSNYPRLRGENPIVIFLVVAAVIVILPRIFAALLPRFAAPAVALILLLIGLLTA